MSPTLTLAKARESKGAEEERVRAAAREQRAREAARVKAEFEAAAKQAAEQRFRLALTPTP